MIIFHEIHFRPIGQYPLEFVISFCYMQQLFYYNLLAIYNYLSASVLQYKCLKKSWGVAGKSNHFNELLQQRVDRFAFKKFNLLILLKKEKVFIFSL